MHNHSYENGFNLLVNEVSFSYEKMGTKASFEKEAKDNLEMTYWIPVIGYARDFHLSYARFNGFFSINNDDNKIHL